MIFFGMYFFHTVKMTSYTMFSLNLSQVEFIIGGFMETRVMFSSTQHMFQTFYQTLSSREKPQWNDRLPMINK